MAMACRACALALLAVPAIALGQQQWFKAVSQNFEVYTTFGEKKAREAILHFEQVRSFFLKATGSKPGDKGRVRIVIFRTDKEYKPYEVRPDTPGFAGGTAETSLIVMRGGSEQEYPIAVHEYVHILMKPFHDKVPLWLNEGNAEFFSTLRAVGKKVRIGDVHPGWVFALRGAKWLDLETLFATEQSSPYYNEEQKRRVFYAESWALVHMLSLTNDYRAQLPAFLKLLSSGTPQSDAFPQAFHKQTWEVWTDLQTYIRKGEFNIGLFDVALGKSAEEPSVVPLTAQESALVLVGVLENSGKRTEAKDAYSELAREHPEMPEPHTGLARLALAGRDLDEARTELDKAVDRGSRDPAAYYDLSVLLAGRGEGRSRPISLLRMALELDPEHREARYNLGHLLFSDGDYKGALEQFVRVRRIEPERALDLFRAMAFASYHLGNHDDALRAIERARPYAKSDEERSRLDEFAEVLRAPKTPPARAVEEPAATPPAAAPAAATSPPATPPNRTRAKIVEATLIQLDCLDEAGRLVVLSGGKRVQLLMGEPDQIQVIGTKDGKFSFNCGKQPPRTVRIAYDPDPDEEYGTAGLVRVIEFK